MTTTLTAAQSLRQQIASTILSQLGGQGRLAVMTGAKNFCALTEGGVSFRVGKNAKFVNYVKVVLNSDDLYDLEFGRISRQGGVPAYTVKSTVEGLYAESLMNVFEAHTKLYLTLGRRA